MRKKQVHECDRIDSVKYIRDWQENQPLAVVCHQDFARFRNHGIVQDRRRVVWVHEPENGAVHFEKLSVFIGNHDGARVLALPFLKTHYFVDRSTVVRIRKVEILLHGVAGAQSNDRVFSNDEEHEKQKNADGKPHRALWQGKPHRVW